MRRDGPRQSAELSLECGVAEALTGSTTCSWPADTERSILGAPWDPDVPEEQLQLGRPADLRARPVTHARSRTNDLVVSAFGSGIGGYTHRCPARCGARAGHGFVRPGF